MIRRAHGHRRTALAALVFACAMPMAADARDASVQDTPARNNCEPQAGITPLCDLQRPEDLEPLDATTLLVSEYGSLGGAPGYLGLFDAADDSYRRLDTTRTGKRDWGDTDCAQSPPAALSPHGIHHSPRAPARVLVVNHGERESIELFELGRGDDTAERQLTWRGCVRAPEGAWLNDVAGLPDGGFVVTHMVSRELDEHELVVAERERRITGWVWRWHPQRGWSRVPGSEGGLPNGIEISDDGRVAYINEYFGDRVTALDIERGERLWQTAVSGPDNNSFAADGSLLVASHLQGLDSVFACNTSRDRPCTLPYAIVALDIASGRARTVLTGGGSDPMGAATVAVQLGSDLYIGSFVGDRMVRRPWPPAP